MGKVSNLDLVKKNNFEDRLKEIFDEINECGAKKVAVVYYDDLPDGRTLTYIRKINMNAADLCFAGNNMVDYAINRQHWENLSND